MLYALMAIDSSIVRYYEIVATWNKHKNTPNYQRKANGFYMEFYIIQPM